MSTKPAGRAPRSAPKSAPRAATKKPASAGLSAEDLADLEASVSEAISPSSSSPSPAPRTIAVGLLRPSPTNPRRELGDLSELAASLKGTGQIQPILVRPHPSEAGAFEVVCGHRRSAAAPLAGLTELLVVVRSLTDREVLEAQIAENSQRADVHPMEEAAALHRLYQDHHVEVEELAARLGRSSFYIYQRLRLMKLIPEATQAFERGRLSLAVALALARFPEANQQIALPSLLVDEGQTPRQLSECRAALDRLTLRLLDSPFALDDASLPGGACTRCPKRSGNQIALFTEAEGPDLCTDPGCYQGKLAALASRMALTPMPPSTGPAGSRGRSRLGKPAPAPALAPALAPAAPSPPPASGPRLTTSAPATGEPRGGENSFDQRVFRLVAEAFLGAHLEPSRRPGLRAATDQEIWDLWVEESVRAAGTDDRLRAALDQLITR